MSNTITATIFKGVWDEPIAHWLEMPSADKARLIEAGFDVIDLGSKVLVAAYAEDAA